MRKLVNMSIAIMILLGSQLHMNAQGRAGREGGGSEYDPMAKPNIVKLNLTSLAFKNISLQYERILGNKISVACNVRLMPKTSLVFSNTIDNASGSDSVNLGDWKAGSLSFAPEFRFYPKHAGKGFYLAPYFRYRNMNVDLPVNYVDDNNKQQNVTATGKFNTYIGGLMIGSQFNLGPMVTLDWYIIGIQYGVTNGDITLKTTQTLSANDQADIKSTFQDIKDASNAFNDITYSTNPNGGTIGGKYGMLGFRGFGLNLGFKF